MGQNENPLVWPAATRLFDNVSQDCATPECLHIRLAMCLSYTRSVRPETQGAAALTCTGLLNDCFGVSGQLAAVGALPGPPTEKRA